MKGRERIINIGVARWWLEGDCGWCCVVVDVVLYGSRDV